jgi:hypothetical protein
MHTIKVIAAGLFICAAIMLLSKMWTTTKPLTGAALSVFLVIWLIISVANLWIGVYRAGYSFAEELPILAVVFFVPAVAGLVAAWFLMNK